MPDGAVRAAPAEQRIAARPPVSLRRSMLFVAVVAAVAAALGIGVRALQTAQVAVDEEQYLVSAISLAEDGNLDITDELREERWRAFADVPPHVETTVLPDGRQISPHDALLPLLLAVPAGIGGWVGAKVALSLLAGLLAALLLWVAVRRFGVTPRTAAVGVAVAASSMPLAVYGQQLYPELPAALVTLLGVAALTGSPDRTSVTKCGLEEVSDRTSVTKCGLECGPGRRELILLVAVVVALPWLSVKYSLVALALVGLGVVRAGRAGMRHELTVLGLVLAIAVAVYLTVHRAVWGGWTAYASGEHFAQTGEFAVVGLDPDYVERALRIVGLLLDREFGLVPWQPAWLLLVPAVAAVITLRVPDRGVLLWPLAAGWFVATFVALTMHGYWFPGRQVVVVLPIAVLMVLVWLDRAGSVVQRIALGLGLAGVAGYGVFLVEGYLRRTTWVVHFVDSHVPVYRLLGPVLTHWRYDYRWPHLVGVAVVAVLAWWGIRTTRTVA